MNSHLSFLFAVFFSYSAWATQSLQLCPTELAFFNQGHTWGDSRLTSLRGVALSLSADPGDGIDRQWEFDETRVPSGTFLVERRTKIRLAVRGENILVSLPALVSGHAPHTFELPYPHSLIEGAPHWFLRNVFRQSVTPRPDSFQEWFSVNVYPRYVEQIAKRAREIELEHKRQIEQKIENELALLQAKTNSGWSWQDFQDFLTWSDKTRGLVSITTEGLTKTVALERNFVIPPAPKEGEAASAPAAAPRATVLFYCRVQSIEEAKQLLTSWEASRVDKTRLGFMALKPEPVVRGENGAAVENGRVAWFHSASQLEGEVFAISSVLDGVTEEEKASLNWLLRLPETEGDFLLVVSATPYAVDWLPESEGANAWLKLVNGVLRDHAVRVVH